MGCHILSFFFLPAIVLLSSVHISVIFQHCHLLSNYFCNSLLPLLFPHYFDFGIVVSFIDSFILYLTSFSPNYSTVDPQSSEAMFFIFRKKEPSLAQLIAAGANIRHDNEKANSTSKNPKRRPRRVKLITWL